MRIMGGFACRQGGADEAGLYLTQVGGQLLADTTRAYGEMRSGAKGSSRRV
jgi:hypothetical protein